MHLFKALLATLLLAIAGLAVANDPVDINTADAKTLETLNGIGPAKAAAIVAYREQNGPFATVEDLANVKGIGLRTVELNRDAMTVGGAAAAPAPATPQPASGGQ
jgi:competence protein ComEA